MSKANTYLILFPPVSYTLSYMQCGPQVTTFYGLRGIPYVTDYIGGLAAGPIKAKLQIFDKASATSKNSRIINC